MWTSGGRPRRAGLPSDTAVAGHAGRMDRITAWLQRLSTQHRPGGWVRRSRTDVAAGVAVAAYLIPQCLAYARLAGLEPVAGLWAAVPALLVYALLGASPLLSIGPESSSAILVASGVASISAEGGASPAAVAAALALAVAVVSAAGWVLRAGFLADLLSRPVVVGFLGGVAAAMVGSQLPNLAGMDVAAENPLARVVEVLGHLTDVSVASAFVGIGVVVGLVALARFRRVPGPLVVLVCVSSLQALLHLDRRGVGTVGEVPTGLPRPTLPLVPAARWPELFVTAVGITVVAFSGNVVTARAFARADDPPVDANRELLAVAGTNLGAGLFGGFPVSSSDSRTALAAAVGGASQLVSVTAASCVALVLLAGGRIIGAIPVPALAGLVVFAAARLVDLQEVRRIVAFRRSEALIMLTAFIGVVAFDVLVGLGLAVALSVADLFRRVARAHDAVQGTVPGLAGLHDVDDYPDAETIPGLVVYRYDAPLCFANAEDFRSSALAALDAEATPVEWLVLNMEANVEIDLTAIDMLDAMRRELEPARGRARPGPGET